MEQKASEKVEHKKEEINAGIIVKKKRCIESQLNLH
jgi:hypothetical protein